MFNVSDVGNSPADSDVCDVTTAVSYSINDLETL